MLARILSKAIRIKLGGEVFFVAQNVSWELQQEADEIREEFLESERFHKEIRLDQIPDFLIKRGLLSETYSKELAGFSVQLNKALIDYFLGFEDAAAKKKNRERIGRIRTSMAKINDLINSHAGLALETLANKIKEDFILAHTITDIHGSPIDSSLIDRAKLAYYKKLPNSKELRLIARTDPWAHIWRTKKGDAFQLMPLSDYQLLLAIFSQMYQGVYESPEKPSAAIIDDDDALDGWFLHQAEKSTKEETGPKKKQHAEEIVFLYDNDGKPENTPERIREILATNSEEASLIQQTRMRQLKNSQTGVMKIEDFKDIKHKKALEYQKAQENARQVTG